MSVLAYLMYIAYRSIIFKLRAYRLFKKCDKLYLSTKQKLFRYFVYYCRSEILDRARTPVDQATSAKWKRSIGVLALSDKKVLVTVSVGPHT